MKIPVNLIPFAKIPKEPLKEMRAVERKMSVLRVAYNQSVQALSAKLEADITPLQSNLTELILTLQERHGLSPEHIVDTTTGYMVVRYAVEQKLNVVPDLPELVGLPELALEE